MKRFLLCMFLAITVSSQNLLAQDIPLIEPLSEEVAQNVLRIYEYGQLLGNQPDVFSKIGDSITESLWFFYAIGEGFYELDEQTEYLQEVIDYYSHSTAYPYNSFSNTSLAAKSGWAAGAALNPEFSDETYCNWDEPPLICEYRISRPSVALILFGTNDVGYIPTEYFRENIEIIIQMSIDRGVIPIISTVPYRVGHEERTQLYNEAIYELADEYLIPVWPYAEILYALPNYGLSTDNIHPSPPYHYKYSANFKSEYLYSGYVLRNLSGLQMLYEVYKVLHPETLAEKDA
ncbi:hypothetical protein MASR2M15_22650 [Anaerolineales bacterium]